MRGTVAQEFTTFHKCDGHCRVFVFLLNGPKFAGWEGRFTPAQDSQPLDNELVTPR